MNLIHGFLDWLRTLPEGVWLVTVCVLAALSVLTIALTIVVPLVLGLQLLMFLRDLLAVLAQVLG
jgi:hypothetical protein